MMSRVRDADAFSSFRCLEFRDELVPVHSFRSPVHLRIVLAGSGRAYSAPEHTDIVYTERYVVHGSPCGTPTSSTSGGHYPGW